ncbi:MAG: hypothetical protein KDN20_18935 [Verrucomicrobiae bacterium]|nr:hypothetical protein [Verrucomicrobiae bacterium]
MQTQTEEKPEQAVVRKRIGIHIPQEVQAFFCCLVLQLHLPILPLFLEYIITGQTKVENVTLTAAIFVVSTSIVSRNSAMLACGIVSSIIFSSLYGVTLAGNAPPTYLLIFGWIAIEATIAIHAVERYNRHVYELEPFFPPTVK